MFGASHLSWSYVALFVAEVSYFVRASCTATAHATEMINQRHASRRALMFGALHLTGLSVACAYFVSASCTATAHATEMINQRHASRRALMFGALHLTGLSVACAYFVSASCTATAHATVLKDQKTLLSERLDVRCFAPLGFIRCVCLFCQCFLHCHRTRN